MTRPNDRIRVLSLNETLARFNMTIQAVEPQDQHYYLTASADDEYMIVSATAFAQSGTCTYSVNINGVPVSIDGSTSVPTGESNRVTRDVVDGNIVERGDAVSISLNGTVAGSAENVVVTIECVLIELPEEES